MPNISQPNHLTPDLDLAPIFAALGDDTRLGILSKLQDGSDQSISSLSEGFPLTRQGVTRHLRVLEDAGLVRSERVGREARYSLEVDALILAKDYLARASAQWEDAIARLTDHLEG